MNKMAQDLLSTLERRAAVLSYLLEEPVEKRFLNEQLSVSRRTIDRAIDELQEWDLIDPELDEIGLTLLGRLVTTVYDDFTTHVAVVTAEIVDDRPLCETNAERERVRRLIAERFEVLECLQTTSLDKRDLVAELDCFRSTVNRAIKELEETELVDRPKDGYTTTSVGQQLVGQYRDTVETITDILAEREFLATLPPDCPIDPALLVEANVERTTDVVPGHFPTGVRERIVEANRVWVYLPVLAPSQLFDCFHHEIVHEGLTLELLTSSAAFETLTEVFSGFLVEMAATDPCTAFVVDPATTDLPPVGLILTETSGSTTVSVILYRDQRVIEGTIHNTSEAAVQWATEWYENVYNEATDVTNDLRDLPSAGIDSGIVGPSMDIDTDRVAREDQGFVQLTTEYFDRRVPAPPVTAWRTGLDPVDIHAGYAIDRGIDPDSDGTRRTLTDDLIGRLSDGTDHALLGAPGSGKSTVCKSVACRWYELDKGAVFYRESATGAAFESPAILSAQLRAADGHVLVVVEDAVRGEANTVFRVMEEFRGDPSVTFLLDARTGEWADPPTFPSDARLDAYRSDVVETVRMPSFDESTAERLIQQFQETTGNEVSPPVPHLLRGIESPATESHEHSGNSPDDLLLLLHRLTLHVAPLADTTANTPTTLAEAVQRTYEDLRDAGEMALDVGLLVNLLNAAGVDVQPAFIFALADAEAEITAIHAALSRLENRIIFERGEGRDDPSYRTIHEAWSELFLHQLLTASETESHASQRFSRCVSALLSLADDEARQTRSATAGRNAPPLERIDRAPGEWADAIVERLFQFGLAHPGLAELFGTTEYATISLPAACSPELELRCSRWRSRMYYTNGSLDRAKSESEHAISLVDADGEPSEIALQLRAQSYTDIGGVAWRRGELDTAAEFLDAGLDGYRAIDDRFGIAKCYSNLGILAHDRGDLDAAIAHFERAHESYREIGVSRELLSKSFNYLGRTFINRGDLDRAEAYLRQSIDVVRDSHEYPELSFTFSNLGEIARLRGNLDRAENYYRRGIDIARNAWYSAGTAYGHLGLGEVALDHGDLDTAAAYVREGLDIYREDENVRGRARGLRCLGSIALKRGTFETAETHLQDAVACCRGDRFPLDKAKTLVELSELAHAREAHVRAREHFEAAIDMFREIGAIRDAITTVERLVAICETLDEPVTAYTHCKMAVTLAREAAFDTPHTVVTEQYTRLQSLLAKRDIVRLR